MAEQEISFDQLPPEAQTAFSTPAPAATETEVDPLTLDTTTLFELTKAKAFDPVQFAQSNPGRATDPDAVAKLADVHAQSRERGFELSDLPSPGQAVKAVAHAGAGIAKQLFNYAQIAAEPFQSLAGYLTGQGPEFQTELAKLNERRAVETAAGTEAAVSGLATLPGKALGKAIQATGLVKPYTQQTAEEKSKAFFDALGQAQTAAEVSQGRGALVGTIAGETVKELEAAGTPVRPEEVETLAAGDPLSFVLFGKAFGAAGNLAAKAVPQSVKVLAGKAATAAEPLAAAPEAVGGRLLQAAGKTVEMLGKGAKAVVTAPGTGAGAIGGALAAGNPGVALGLAIGRPVAKGIAGGVQSVGENVAAAGKRIATQEGFTPYVQLARDVFASAPLIATGALKGAAFDLGLAAATAETPAETEAASAFGTVLGGLHGVGRAGMRAVQGQIVAPRAWGTAVETPAYGSFPALDALNAAAQRSRAPGEVLRSNAIRQFLKGAGDKAQAYLMPDAASMEKALTDLGYSPENAKTAAAQQGMFVENLTDASGNPRRVVFLNSADVAPHEAFHGIQDVLGEKANTVVDGLVFQEYAPQWEQLGNQYADRLGKGSPGESWRDTVLDVSKWGDAAAAEKALRDAGNRIRNETGAEPNPQAARDLAEAVLTKARESGAGWREILTPEEAAQEANRYLARELAAENFDVAFKNLGSSMEGNSLPQKLARIVANTASFLGAEPLAGAPRTEVLGIEPRFNVLQGTAELGRSLVEASGTRAPVDVLPKTTTRATATTPFSPAERAAAGEQAGTFANEVAARNPQTGEVLRKIASAISSGQGIKVEYRAAPGEPAGSPNMSREARRAIIEAFREMPEDVRPLWEKLNFPDRVESTKNKGFQIVGWSPENYAANAQKMAKFIADIQGRVPEAKNWSPYEIDATTKSFTADGWRKLYEDAQTFVKNQQAGGTGSGRPLQLPADAAAMRINVPPLRESALVGLNQHAADFHNVLFNIMLPETTRASRKGGTPGNIVAQRIARANEPVVGPRVVEPGRVRSQAEFKGFPGERIQEVNPLRARMEKAASDAGTSFPSLIETSQRLNLDHIVDVTPTPEAPAIRGVTDTLRAGFAPAKSVQERGRELIAMPPEAFIKLTTEWPGGLTGEAQRLGLSLTAKEDVATLRNFANEAQTEMKARMAARDIDNAMSLASKKQFFSEAIETATGTGGNADFLRKQMGDAYVPPFPEGATTAAKIVPPAESKAQFAPKASEEVRDVAKKYAEEAGIPYAPAQTYRTLNSELGKRLADFYEGAQSNPTDPAVQKSYRALADETMRQYEVMKDAGYTIEPWNGEGEPYKNSAAAIADARDNKHLYFLKTEKQFGPEGEALNQDNVLLNDSGISINGGRLLVNDIFRAVHDFFGHAKEGFEFGPRGEFNAWAVHSEMFSPEAQGALAAETLAQNSWVNFGKHLRNEAGNIPAKGEPGYKSPTERPFGEQKNLVVPQELIDEARAQFAPKKKSVKDESKFLPADASGVSKAWILPSGKIEQLGGKWHHAWLDENPEVAQRYKLSVPKFEGGDAEGVREGALRKGFVRVNYGRNMGTLTVEARAKDWRHQKAAVEKLVEKNLDDIDNITVHLLDETASKVVDSDSERLFRHDEDVDKMANLPFITKEGGETRAQFSPAAETTLSSEEFGKELTKIRAGQSGGQTFNSDGTVWKAPAEPVDVVTLASVNIPLGSAKPEAVREALAQYEDLLNQPGIVAGVFAFSKDGKPTMSADINAVVPQEFRDNSFNFVKDNDQVSFWDAAKNEEVKTGGRGNTKLSTVDQLLSAQEALLKGEPVDVAALSESTVGESQELPGLGTGREFQRDVIANMTRAELQKHFPEAIVPRNKAEEIPYEIVESPLFKAAGNREAAVKSFGRKLVEFYRENERSPELKAGEKWYSEFTPLLKKEFGKDAQIFAELLAATSPNTEPGVNFQFAFDALSNWKAGKFDSMIKKFNEGFERLSDGSLQKIYDRDVAAGKVKNPPAKPSEATYMAHWIIKNDLVPISSTGKRFGMHSEAVLKVLSRRWLSQTAGPKTQNFVKNLVGTGHEATVDVWASRTMRRLGYAGSKERWRILPANSKGVSDVDFAFSQEAFREAAKEIGIKPDALQGALWFAEKLLWSQNGWGRLSLGDFRAEIEKVPMLKKEFARKNLVEPKKKVAQMSLLDDLVTKK